MSTPAEFTHEVITMENGDMGEMTATEIQPSDISHHLSASFLQSTGMDNNFNPDELLSVGNERYIISNSSSNPRQWQWGNVYIAKDSKWQQQTRCHKCGELRTSCKCSDCTPIATTSTSSSSSSLSSPSSPITTTKTTEKCHVDVELKIVSLSKYSNGIPPFVMREIGTLRGLYSNSNTRGDIRSDHIIALLDVFEDAGKLILVNEHVQMDLCTLLTTITQPLSTETLRSYSRQLCMAVEYCHEHSIIHRNIQPKSIRVNHNKRVIKLSDFGLSRSFVPPIKNLTKNMVNLWYRAPEMLLGDTSYALPVDVWSVGVTIAEMSTLLPLFPGASEIDAMYLIFQCRGTPTEQSWAGVTHLPHWQEACPQWSQLRLEKYVPHLDQLGVHILHTGFLCLDPRKRICLTDALNHPFLNLSTVEIENDAVAATKGETGSKHILTYETALHGIQLKQDYDQAKVQRQIQEQELEEAHVTLKNEIVKEKKMKTKKKTSTKKSES